MSRNKIDKEAFVKAFSSYLNAMFPDSNLSVDHRDETAAKALKEFEKEVKEATGNPQSYQIMVDKYDEALKIFHSRLLSRLDKSYKKQEIKRTIKKDHLDKYPLKVAAEMMGYVDEETVKKKIDDGIIKAINTNPDGRYAKYEISIEEIYKHKRADKK